MKKNKIILGLLSIVLIALLGGVVYLKKTKESVATDSNNISLGKCDITIETVATEELRKKGLSNRDALCQNCGMLFLFEKESNYSFWMKDMRFPIDIVWLRNNKVVDISRDISHQSKSVHTSKELVDKVLELNAGEVNRCGIKISDKLKK